MSTDRKPDWYKKLQNGPMKKRGDKEEFIRKIKQSIHKTEGEYQEKYRRPFRINVLAATVICTFAIVLVNFQQSWFGSNKQSVQSSTQIEVKMKDESTEDQSLKQFMNELNQKLSVKDTNVLHDIINEEIIFKGEKYNKNERKSYEGILNNLQVALAMGGEFINDTKSLYKIPSGLAESNQNKNEHYLYGTVVGEKTKIFAQPQNNSRVVYHASNEMVKAWMPAKIRGSGYIKVTTMNGYTGYVEESRISTDIEYSFTFEKQNDGMWKIKMIDSIW
ncbi:hypothetical protein [Bacillus gaemokensis]|uniref:ECF-type sigma factor negative effector n=1 Tax=Bacillus gaemokensis TaxID=574375 RepID=A0A073K5S9_9BACI|nr:hypothetical protein [Bacillus gaemokensis]KEK22649.1 ECF-type sigma factor negative effector [Bacillus gaemokensis]KYG28926.1 anti-sigma factor [Bacillus gaemokensis]